MVTSLVDDSLPDVIPLTPREKKLKAELEKIVAHGLDEFLRVGNASPNSTIADFIAPNLRLFQSTSKPSSLLQGAPPIS
jgi:hypothetical protein